MIKRAIYPGARDLVQRCRAEGHEVVLVSGALDFLMERLAKHLGATGHISNRLEIKDGYATGKLLRPIVAGPEKARLVREWARDRGHDLGDCFAYSDSYSDVPMLSVVGHPCVVNPDLRLHKLARTYAWPVITLGERSALAPAAGAHSHEHHVPSSPPCAVVRARAARQARGSHPLVVTLDKKSAPRAVFSGDQLLEVDLPAGTRCIYPRPPMEALKDVDAAIRYALNHPLGSDPLHAKLRPGMKVVIAIDDISLPLPPMRRPDVRERVLTVVLEMLADHGVEDVEIIIATSVHRRMTAQEVRWHRRRPHLRRVLARPPLQPRRRGPEGA